MKGYYNSYGYMGYIPGKGYTLFASEGEYEECYEELSESERSAEIVSEIYALMAEIDHDLELYKRNKKARAYSRSVWRRKRQKRNHRLALLAIAAIVLVVFVVCNPMSVV